MKLHFVSRGYAVALAFQAQNAGSKVTVHVPDSPCGTGMFPRVAEPACPGRVDAVIVDGLGWGAVVDDMRKDGRRVLFGGKWAELLNAHPDAYLKTLHDAGYEPLPTGAILPPYRLIVGAWFENGWRPPYYCGMVTDRMLAGDLGLPQGPVAAQLEPLAHDAALVEQFLHPLTHTLNAVGYAGLVSVGLARAGKLYVCGLGVGVQPQVTEAVSEMVYGGFPALVSESGGEPSGDCAASIALSMPYWPGALQHFEPTVRFNLDSGQRKRFWPLDVRQDGDAYEYCETSGVVGSVSSRGRPAREDSEDRPWCIWHRESTWRCYKTIGRINVPCAQYRNDLGRNTDKLLSDLESGTGHDT